MDIEVVAGGGVSPQHLLGLVHGDVVEGAPQPLLRVRPGALGMREVVAPHEVAHTDLVAAGQLPPARV